MRYIQLSELIDESDASDEANRLGLDYLSFGRWGKDGKVTHVSKNGKLVPADNSGSHVGQPATPEDPNADIRATPLKKIPYGDYGGNQPKPKAPQPAPDVNKLSSMTPKPSQNAISSYTDAKNKLDIAKRTLDKVPEDNPSLYDRAEQVFFAASDAVNKSKAAALDYADNFDWGVSHDSEEELAVAKTLADAGRDFNTNGVSPEYSSAYQKSLDRLSYTIDDYEMALDDDMPDALDRVAVAAADVQELRRTIKDMQRSPDDGDYYGNNFDG